MKIWAFCVFMPQKLQDMSSFLGFGGNSALLRKLEEITNLIYAEIDNAISSTSTYIRSLFDNKKRSIL